MINVRRGPLALGAGATAAVLLLWAGPCTRDAPREAVSKDDLCEVITEIEPGTAFAGGSASALASATAEIADLRGRASGDVGEAIDVVAQRADAFPQVLDLPGLEQGDDGYAEAFQAAYALRFDSQLAVAAALIERYGVDECGLEASGLFDIDAVRASDLGGAEIPVLSQEELDGLRVEFDPAEFSEFELQPFEVPEVTFDEDFGEFTLDPPEFPQPDLGS